MMSDRSIALLNCASALEISVEEAILVAVELAKKNKFANPENRMLISDMFYVAIRKSVEGDS